MSEVPNISEEYNYFEKLFEKAEKEQIGDLYKKELYIMKEDLDKNNSKSKLKLMHDILMEKLLCEDYKEITIKSEIEKQITPQEKKGQNNIINNNKNNSKDDVVDKELAEEVEYLKDLYRLNYLTFSPLALNSFDKIREFSNNNQNNNDENNNNIKEKKDINIMNSLEENKKKEEKEDKILKIINFDYNSFELNNDLLFNICQGFIDVSKLKETNIKIPTQEQQKEILNDSSDSSKNDEYDIYEYDEELEQDLANKIMNFVHKYENNLMFKGAIIRFRDEQRNLPPKCKNKIKNLFFRKWEKEFINLEKKNEIFQKKKKEDDKKKELKKQKKYLDKLKEKKSKDIEDSKYIGYGEEFINELKKIQKEAILKSGIDKKEKNKTRMKKRFNKNLSSEKDDTDKSNKKYYCSGFNLYKEIISGKQRNTSSKK